MAIGAKCQLPNIGVTRDGQGVKRGLGRAENWGLTNRAGCGTLWYRVSNDRQTEAFSVRLTPKTRASIRQIAARLGVSQAAVIAMAVSLLGEVLDRAPEHAREDTDHESESDHG